MLFETPKKKKIAPDASVMCTLHHKFHRYDESCSWCPPPPKYKRWSQDPANWSPQMFTAGDLDCLMDEQIEDLLNAYVNPAWNPTFEEIRNMGCFEINVIVDSRDDTRHLNLRSDGRRVFEWELSNDGMYSARRNLAKWIFLNHNPRLV